MAVEMASSFDRSGGVVLFFMVVDDSDDDNGPREVAESRFRIGSLAIKYVYF